MRIQGKDEIIKVNRNHHSHYWRSAVPFALASRFLALPLWWQGHCNCAGRCDEAGCNMQWKDLWTPACKHVRLSLTAIVGFLGDPRPNVA
jgi:hypothetical protein